MANSKQLFLSSQISECANIGKGEIEAELIFVSHRPEGKAAVFESDAATIPVVRGLYRRVLQKSDIRVKTGLKRFLPAVLSGEFENSEVELVAWQGSGDIAATARANCYIVVPPDRERLAAGEWVAVMMR